MLAWGDNYQHVRPKVHSSTKYGCESDSQGYQHWPYVDQTRIFRAALTVPQLQPWR